jgi:hypothetical protein
MRRFDETGMKVPKLLLPGLCLMAAMASGQKFDPRILNQLEWTNIGPAAMGAAFPGLKEYPAIPASFTPPRVQAAYSKPPMRALPGKPSSSDPERSRSGYCDPKNPNTIWVGTGEANLRNSVSFT